MMKGWFDKRKDTELREKFFPFIKNSRNKGK